MKENTMRSLDEVLTELRSEMTEEEKERMRNADFIGAYFIGTDMTDSDLI